MRNLEVVIAQFVGDLLRTMGEATVDDLRELFAGRPESENLEGPVDFSPPALPGPANRPALPPRALWVDERESRHSTPSAASRYSTSSGSLSPPGVAEITDPESLLLLGRSSEGSGSNGAGSSNGAYHSSGAPADRTAPSFVDAGRAPSRARAQALLEVPKRPRSTPRSTPPSTDGGAEPEGESPASSVRPLGAVSTVKLSDNETLARVSNSGVVIRRKKREQA